MKTNEEIESAKQYFFFKKRSRYWYKKLLDIQNNIQYFNDKMEKLI